MAAFKPAIYIFVCCWLAGICNGNDPPFVSFGPSTGHVIFPEDTQIGTSLFEISARDDDSANVFIEIDTNNKETVNLVELGNMTHTAGQHTWRTDVLLKAALDRDRAPNQRTLLFNVRDEQSTIAGKVNLIIRDVNDNPPAFVNLPYRITLKENAPIDQSVFQVTAADPDDGPGGSVRYSMAAQAQGADDTYNTTFVIENTALGDVILKRALDYEKRNYYQFQVFAKDAGNPPCPGEKCKCNNISEPHVKCEGEPAVFVVTVTDVQDTPPFFERLPYFTSILENATIGTSVFQVSALDGDRGVPNDVTYSIVDADEYPFNINNETGVLTVRQALDADNVTRYTMFVMASEVTKPNEQLGNTTATTRVSITVVDVNDNAPNFTETQYVATVLENTPKGVPLTLNSTIEVKDKDQGENGQFNLTVMKDGAPYTVFDTLPPVGSTIHGTSTVIIRVLDSSVLDYETTKSITFQLVATEINTAEQFNSSTTVTVFLEDMNDNTPVFVNEQKKVNVTEHSKNDTVLATFTATDADSGEFGKVIYSLEEGQGQGKFAIGNITGNLTVVGDIDRDPPTGRAFYQLVVVATDNPAGEVANQRPRRLTVDVTVLDINDNSPKFQFHPATVTVQENAPNGTNLMTLTAADLDEGDNGKVVYEVLTSSLASSEGLFDIDRDSGRVTINASLIGHSGQHTVTFVAKDSAPNPMQDNTTIEVLVQDVNLNPPVFVQPDQSEVNTTSGVVPSVNVTEGQPFVFTLNATDEDTGQNGAVTYRVEPDLNKDYEYFDVVPQTGYLTNSTVIDLEDINDRFGRPYLQISVKAEDNGSPFRLSSVIPFRVNLTDIDNKDPEFPKGLSPYPLSVGEESANVTVGFVNVSTDKDLDPENWVRCFYLYGGEMLDAFTLNKNDGELFLLKALDRDKIPQVNLIVKVTRNCSLPEDHFSQGTNHSYNESDSSLLKVHVTVLDINDNPPVLNKAALTTGMLYDVEIGTSVLELRDYTSDNDTEEHSNNKFRLVKNTPSGGMPEEFKDAFSVEVNGSVVTRRLFQANLKGYFILTVEAYDDDNHTDIGDARIYLVSDAQRLKLVFNNVPNKIRELKGNLTTELSEALGYDVIADKIATHVTSNGEADPTKTDVYIHARYKSGENKGEVVPTTELDSAFDFNDRVREIFLKYGVQYALPALSEKQEEADTLLRPFIIVGCVLGIICLVLIAVLVNTIRRYRRRLRAATTSAYLSEKQVQNAFVPPGTNKYFAAENPLFGHDVKIVDPDRLSTDSLDDNAVDGARSGDEKEKDEEQEMYVQLYDEQHGPGTHVNHLAMVLHEYDKELTGQPETSPMSSPSATTGSHADDGWKTPMNGHVKADSGFNEQGPVERPDGFQYTDI